MRKQAGVLWGTTPWWQAMPRTWAAADIAEGEAQRRHLDDGLVARGPHLVLNGACLAARQEAAGGALASGVCGARAGAGDPDMSCLPCSLHALGSGGISQLHTHAVCARWGVLPGCTPLSGYSTSPQKTTACPIIFLATAIWAAAPGQRTAQCPMQHAGY